MALEHLRLLVQLLGRTQERGGAQVQVIPSKVLVHALPVLAWARWQRAPLQEVQLS
jgi:hypothetical protein